MKQEKKLSKINLYDKFNAAFVSMITPEMSDLKKIRKQNSYSSTPTLVKPFEMPLEFISINGVKIRMSKSVIDLKNKETIILLSAFPHSIIAYSPVWSELKKDYNVYAYDLPGFGASETKPGYMSFNFQGGFLNSFIKHFDSPGRCGGPGKARVWVCRSYSAFGNRAVPFLASETRETASVLPRPPASNRLSEQITPVTGSPSGALQAFPRDLSRSPRGARHFHARVQPHGVPPSCFRAFRASTSLPSVRASRHPPRLATPGVETSCASQISPFSLATSDVS